MSRMEKIKEHIKSVILGVLLVALVCLCVVYILSFSGKNTYEFTGDDMEAVGSESIKYQYSDYLDVSYVSPQFIGFSADKYGENIGFYTLGGENSQIYESILPFFDRLFGEQGRVERLSFAAGERLFSSLLKGDYIYLSYAADLPKSLIRAANEDVLFEGVSGEYFSEILIVPKDYLREELIIGFSGARVRTSIYSFYAVARDTAGNYYRYTTSFVPTLPQDTAFHTNFYLTYTTTEDFLTYRFACEWEEDAFMREYGFSREVTDTTVIPLSEGEPVGAVVRADEDAPDTEETNAILETLLLNPEKISSYTDESGVVFYFDEGKNISVSPTGLVSYSVHGTDGISLPALFDWHAGAENYDIYDYYGAALVAARGLERAHREGNDYDIYLSGVYYDGEVLTFSFGYAADGFPIYFDGEAEVLRFSFASGMLQAVECRLYDVTVTEETAPVGDVLFKLRAYIKEYDEKRRFFCGYAFSENTTGSVELLGSSLG